MKKLFYQTPVKVLAWILLFVSLTAAIASTTLSVYCLTGGITKTEDGYEIELENSLMEERLPDVTEYIWKRNSGTVYEGDVARFREEYGASETNFRYFVKDLYWSNGLNWDYTEGTRYSAKYGYASGYEIWYGADYSNPVPDDLYVVRTVGIFAYEYRYLCMGVALGSICLTVLLTVYLVMVAGRREPGGEVSKTWIHRVPYELLITAWIWYIALLVMGINEVMTNSLKDIVEAVVYEPAFLVLGALTWVLTFGVTAGLIHSLVVRIHTGAWYRTFFIYRVARLLWKGGSYVGVQCKKGLRKVQFYVEYWPLYTRFAVLYVLLSILEVVVILCCGEELGWLLVCWGIYKLILTPVILWYIISLRLVEKYGEQIATGNYGTPLQTRMLAGRVKYHAENLRKVEDGLEKAVGEKLKSERMKTELITNVSHDIKTPLTSIINYVDLLKKEDLQPEVAKEYVEVLERQSARLKKLTEDVIEASKAASGAITTQIEATSLEVLLPQVLGEYEERMASADLYLIQRIPEKLPMVMADARLLWRVLSNLLENAYKYSQRGTRVYFTAEEQEHSVQFWIRNISAMELNVNGEELMERFVRGDDSRNTEGSGLGLSIAKSLLDLMHGEFDIQVDGDLFKVLVTLPKAV